METKTTKGTVKNQNTKIIISKTNWLEMIKLRETPSDTHNLVLTKLIEKFKKGKSGGGL